MSPRATSPSPARIRIGFVKFAGLSTGGTEKFLQTIAANLSRDRFEVDYFYCDAAPYIGSDHVHASTDPDRLRYMREHGVNLIKFHVAAKDLRTPTHDWVSTDFWQVFDERRYDMIQTARAGHPEYPFTKMRRVPIVDSLHLVAGPDNQPNIARVMHISEWSAKRWVDMGGDSRRVVVVSHPTEIDRNATDLRSELGLDGKFVFGLHQRDQASIFSEVPLAAYSMVEGEHTHFLLLGGGDQHRRQAADLGLQHITFLPHTGEQRTIERFLATLDVYAHGRKDGEVNSTALAQALAYGLPVVTHPSEVHNGHLECLGAAAEVADSADAYAARMRRLQHDPERRDELSRCASRRFQELYELDEQMRRISAIYESVNADPFPHPLHRRWTHVRSRYLRPRAALRYARRRLRGRP
jgi:glycosyltransferase involved in cell wall biosynthesis